MRNWTAARAYQRPTPQARTQSFIHRASVVWLPLRLVLQSPDHADHATSEHVEVLAVLDPDEEHLAILVDEVQYSIEPRQPAR